MTDDRLPDDFEPEQHEVYHDLLAFSRPNQALFSHPTAEPMSDEQWATLCHNFALYAAVASAGDNLVVTTEDGDVIATSETGRLQ